MTIVGMEVVSIRQGLVLSYASNITVSDLYWYSSVKRQEAKVPLVVLNEKLNQAAKLKAADMFSKQYWAHTSPTGEAPWSFFNKVSYNYVYAGENLARDFGDSKSVVDAWMNSPSHRENLLNSRYRDIGFAVVNGKYGSYETTLVVQLFGSPAVAPSVNAPTRPKVLAAPEPVPPSVLAPAPANETLALPSSNGLSFDAFALIRLFSLGMSVFLVILLFTDGFLTYQRRIFRLSGHSFAHFLFFLGITIVVLVLRRGVIL